MMSFSSGLVSKSGKDAIRAINAENCVRVGVEIQTTLDGQSFVDKISTKQKVSNLASLKKPIKVNEKTVVIIKLFTRLILISEKETSVEESLCYELTQVPMTMSLYDNNQQMRKANKAALGTYLKKIN